MNEATHNPTVSDRLAELRAKKEAIDAAREIERKAREVEELELEVRFDGELGPRGSQFEIINTGEIGEGCIVVKLGEEVLFKRFQNSKLTAEDAAAFVRPCVVYPSQSKYDEITARRGFIATRCANALATLYGVKLEANAGK
jgi:hypothetical protein